MTNTAEPAEGPDSHSTKIQAAALAEHLQRIGVQWLPTPNPSAVETLENQFAKSAESSSPQIEDASQSPGPQETPPQAPSTQAASAQTASAQTPNNPTPPATTTRPANKATSDAAPSSFSLLGQTDAAGTYPGETLDAGQRSDALAAYAEQVSQCTRCELLAKCRNKTVFGEGSTNPRVVFFGEGPGRDEDLAGRPFVGKAGQLLTKMIKACTFEREDVYIMNTVKCRPPNNRNPEPTEIENCREYFEAQLQILRPEYIVCLGLVSAQALLKTKLSVGRMRGKFHPYFDSKVLVTYHPAYLLRTPAAKKAAWEDLQMMLRDAKLID